LEINQEKWTQKFREHDIDLETFSTLKDDQQLKDIVIDVLGALRRLLKEMSNKSRLQDFVDVLLVQKQRLVFSVMTAD
jgi:hypothetical protein